MATELVVREPFGLEGKNYQRGDHITDSNVIEAVKSRRSKFVRAINVPEPAANKTPAPEATAASEGAH